MRISFLQFLIILCLGVLFFADFPRLAKIVKEKVSEYKNNNKKN
ncbi:unnamed protein product [Ascophyllum nodosum]